MTPDEEKQAFKEKLRSIHWGIVPGGYRDTASTTMVDSDAILDQFGDTFSKERVEDKRSDFRAAYKDFQEHSA